MVGVSAGRPVVSEPSLVQAANLNVTRTRGGTAEVEVWVAWSGMLQDRDQSGTRSVRHAAFGEHPGSVPGPFQDRPG
jgi:hypothetical protein